MASSRVANSIRNVFAAWGGQAISAVASFVVRMVFVDCLAAEYVGLETLFASVLTILSLADLGIGSAIVFSLYDPLAKGDKELTKSLMRLFKRCYIAIGSIIIIVGLLVAPHISVIVGPDAPDIPYLELYFFCFVLNTGVSYFFSYKGSLIMADQKNYIVYIIQYAFQILMSIAQIAVLLITGNYLLFLACMIASTVLQNIVIVYKANKMYPYLKEKDVQPVNKEVLTAIKKNVLGLIMHKVAGVASTPVSNLVITGFVGLAATSLYGNYLLIVNALSRIVEKVFDSIIASVGNLGVTESEDRQHEVFRATFFVNAFVYALACGGALCAFNPFITIWLGPEWCFPPYIVICVVLLFYAKGMRCAGMAFTSAYGLYWYTKWKAVLEAISLPVLSIILVKPFGIAGVMLAGVISSVFISTIYEAWAVYAHGFHGKLRTFVWSYLQYTAVTFASVGVAFVLCEMLPLGGVLAFFVKGFIGVAIPFAAYAALYHKSAEWKEIAGIIHRVMEKVRPHKSEA